MNTDAIKAAAIALQHGGIIAYPTEAVYGLGCDPQNEAAVLKLLALKKRNASKGLILIAANLAQLTDYLAPVTSTQMQTALATWPGPVTWVFPATSHTPAWIRGNHNTIAVRVTAHPIAKQLCQTFGYPLVSTSANVQNATPAMTVEQLQNMFPAGIELIVPGVLGGDKKPSQIRDVVTGKILR